ncbi:uncharacterized protein DUF3822 [Tenacibaculum adriaticum]|uniref:Uncharacterized protein DUF3822 n=1 Tax=Tenacibaculum adriaticum TaxID=413713 RepID=A0A5S5DTM1_9FLAO|nr:DUF3822 family protein [Tenacibaculum adriaticum]TYP98718.1 uncharacterized protein DUF3822 [Tenacibaculum adriaticum]
MLRKNKHTSVQSQHKSLSIQFSLDGFSFCISDIPSKEPISFTEYSFDVSMPTPELLLNEILVIFAQDKDLQQDFDEISVIHQNNLSTIVPDDFFDETQLKSYLNYNIKTLVNDHIVYDELQNIEAKNIYIPFVNINNYLFQNFGEFEFKHHSSILIDKLLQYSRDEINKHFFVHVYHKNIDIVITQGNKLIFYNSFPFNSKEDFIYYILFVAEQLEMNPDEFTLTFLGAIEEESDFHKITYDYIRNITFINTSSDFFNNSDDFSKHSNYILVS